VIISYLGSFGGHHIIPFGWDFLWIGLFSLIIFYTAIRTRSALNTKKINDYIMNESMALEH
jgi:hypothetical protein